MNELDYETDDQSENGKKWNLMYSAFMLNIKIKHLLSFMYSIKLSKTKQSNLRLG